MKNSKKHIYFIVLCCCALTVCAQEAVDVARLMKQGIALRHKGDIALSIQSLQQAQQLATTAGEQTIVAGELGASLFQARRYDDADVAFTAAYNSAKGPQKAQYALDRGNVASVRKQPDKAAAFYREAKTLAPLDPVISVSAALNLARLAPDDDRLPQLQQVANILPTISDPAVRARYQINLGSQARAMGPKGAHIAYEALHSAQNLLQHDKSRLQVEALDGLAQLYEDQARIKDAMKLNQQALQVANPLEISSISDLMVVLYWRQGRLQALQGNNAAALVSYQRAVDLIETIRLDIPIEYDDGRSSYKALMEPIYIGLADLLLKSAATQSPEQQQAVFQRVSHTTELLKQTEMQDFLGDRCAIEEIKGSNDDGGAHLPPNTAVYYPLVLENRTELLVSKASGMQRVVVPVGRVALQKMVSEYDELLRYKETGYLSGSQHLYDALIRPIESILQQQGIDQLIIVPDSSLRILPFASLHDGKQFLVEKIAIASVVGMSMTTVGDEGVIDHAGIGNALVVGMSTPGPVLGKLASMEAVSAGNDTDAQAFSALRATAFQEKLALPGVDQEVLAINSVLSGATLQNENFTLDNFRQQVIGGDYQILHIASHGVFGGTDDTSYIMAYDDIIGMNDLQKILNTGRSKQHHIRLLTLSACETAEGSESAPIGIAGAAVKARARSVLGTLWPVADSSTQVFMELFYRGMVEKKLSKAEALRQAQVAMIRTPEMSHPFSWAPFTLIGNWQ